MLFRAVLAETLLLQSFYAPAMTLARWWLWGLLGLYAAVAGLLFWLDRRQHLPVRWMLGSFFFDIGVTSLILHATGGFAGDFYVAYFLVILSSCLIESLAFSFLVGGIACLVYAALAFPGIDAAFNPFYLLRLSLLLATAFFSTYIADHARRVQKETAESYEERLDWMRRLSQVGQALARILHEIKTPLGTISLTTEYLRQSLLQGQPQELEERLRVIEAAADRASAIVRDYLEFGKPTQISLKPLPVQEPLEEALSGLRLRLEERDILLSSALARQTMVLGSRRHLVQLFTILLDNALAAMPLAGRLNVDAGESGGQARVRITDTGVGIDPDMRSRLFEPFATSRPESGGTGLGLSIARWIVLRHGGNISLQSDGPARGTTVIVDLPLAQKFN